MEPTSNDVTAEESAGALEQLGLTADQVESVRAEGYTLIVITTAEEKHRIVREHLFPKKPEEE